MGNPIFLGLKS